MVLDNPIHDHLSPAGDHVGIVVFSPLNSDDIDVGWICLSSVQFNNCHQILLFLIRSCDDSLKKHIFYVGTLFLYKWPP